MDKNKNKSLMVLKSEDGTKELTVDLGDLEALKVAARSMDVDAMRAALDALQEMHEHVHEAGQILLEALKDRAVKEMAKELEKDPGKVRRMAETMIRELVEKAKAPEVGSDEALMAMDVQGHA